MGWLHLVFIAQINGGSDEHGLPTRVVEARRSVPTRLIQVIEVLARNANRVGQALRVTCNARSKLGSDLAPLTYGADGAAILRPHVKQRTGQLLISSECPGLRAASQRMHPSPR